MKLKFRLLLVLFAACFSQGSQAAADEVVFMDPDDTTKPLAERMLLKKNQKVRVKVDSCKYKDVKFEEKERQSRLYEDVRAVFGKLLAGLEAVCPNFTEYSHTLKYDRSKLTLIAVSVDEKQTPTMTVITGPKEHLFLGLDLPVTKTSQLKYNDSTKTLEPKDTNPQLYLSLNWYIGDVAAKQETQRGFDRFSVKALVLASTRPLDSMGLGVGYQLPDLKVVDLSAVNVFVGHFWTKQDDISSTGTALTNKSTTRDWRFGITYDVGAALKYVKFN